MSKETNRSNNSRRSFLVKLGIGVAGLASVSAGLVNLGKKPNAAVPRDFPGPDSIFHPASDPRQDPRRS